MKIFNLDLHVSVVADFMNIVREVRPDVAVTDWSLSGHTWVFNREPTPVEIVTQSSWYHLCPDMVRAFQQKYDDFLSEFDAFFVGHVMAFCMLFEKYGKPIFAWNTCRYDLPFCFSKSLAGLEAYHACLRRLCARGLLTVHANNRGDQTYLELGTGLKTSVLPSLGRYTRMRHAPTREAFFWHVGQKPPEGLVPLVVPRPERYAWTDLEHYAGVVHVPYECSTMSMAEHYTAGLPLFIPTSRLLLEWWHAGTNRFQSVSSYWGAFLPNHLKMCADPTFWLSRADFCDPENIRFAYRWDDFEDLRERLAHFTDRERDARLDHIEARTRRTLAGWEKTLNERLGPP